MGNKKITMCNYYGMCDSNSNVMGHTCKVTKEYFELLSKRYTVSLTASPCIIDALNAEGFQSIRKLSYNIRIDEPFTIKKRILDKIKLLKNLQECFQKEEDRVLFFYQVDFFFFFYVSLFYRRHSKKIYCLIFHQDFTGGPLEKILGRFYKKALKKIDGILYTQKGHPVIHPSVSWMPDYLYTEKRYGKYQRINKQEKAVCLGTMNRYKCLEELVEVFSKTGYPLEITGRFDSTERYERLKRKAAENNAMKNNITIENRLLTEEEYYEILGSAKFSLLPYDMAQYQNRTSGVLLESLYVGSIPIAPSVLLEQNELPGIGYEALSELGDMALEAISDDIIEDERRSVLEEFGEGRAAAAMESIFCEKKESVWDKRR